MINKNGQIMQLLAAYVDADPVLANERDHLLANFETKGGRYLGPQGAAELMYKIGRFIAINEKKKRNRCLYRDGSGNGRAGG